MTIFHMGAYSLTPFILRSKKFLSKQTFFVRKILKIRNISNNKNFHIPEKLRLNFKISIIHFSTIAYIEKI